MGWTIHFSNVFSKTFCVLRKTCFTFHFATWSQFPLHSNEWPMQSLQRNTDGMVVNYMTLQNSKKESPSKTAFPGMALPKCSSHKSCPVWPPWSCILSLPFLLPLFRILQCTLAQEAVLSLCTSSIQLWCPLPFGAMAVTTAVRVYLLYFPLSLGWSVPLGLSHSIFSIHSLSSEQK